VQIERVQNAGFSVLSFGSRVSGLGFRVQGIGITASARDTVPRLTPAKNSGCAYTSAANAAAAERLSLRSEERPLGGEVEPPLQAGIFVVARPLQSLLLVDHALTIECTNYTLF
jgi:hypothetical protein